VFESIYEKRDNRSKRLFWLLIGALILHAVVLTTVLIVDFLRVSPVPQPAVTITLLDAASLAPPPPPPPPPKKPKPKTVQKKVEQPKDMLAPKEIPKDIPKDEPTSDEPGGDVGGVEGGIEGGVSTGQVAPPPPPPPPPQPLKPVLQNLEVAKRRRMAGIEPEYPYRARLQGWEATLIARIHLSPTGEVERIDFVQTDPNFEDSVRKAILTWRFKPFVVDGKAVSTYFVQKFVFRLQ
jgi:periplasmic protein TonB